MQKWKRRWVIDRVRVHTHLRHRRSGTALFLWCGRFGSTRSLQVLPHRFTSTRETVLTKEITLSGTVWTKVIWFLR
jgi:hypothetical protein